MGDRGRKLLVVALIAADVSIAIAQIATDRPAAGPLGVILFLAPAFVLTIALSPRTSAWPQLVLTVLGMTIVLGVCGPMVAALSPVGLHAASIGATQLVAALVAFIIWLARLRRGHRVWRGMRFRVTPRDATLALAGAALAVAGVFVARDAAEQQHHAGFVQLWSVPVTGGRAEIGVRNQLGVTLDCELSIERAGAPVHREPVGQLTTGASWTGSLPSASPGSSGASDILLRCSAPDGTTVDRRLRVEAEG